MLQSIVKVYFKLNGQRLSSGLQVTYIDDHSGIYSATDGIGRGRLKALLWAGNPSYMGHHTSHHHFYSLFIPHFSQPSSFLRFRHLLTKFCILLSSIIFIGPESDHWQCLSVTDSLTHSLTHCRLVNLSLIIGYACH